MAKCFTSWTVLPHDPAHKLAENLWCVEGIMPDASTRRKMTVIRLLDGSLLFHNAIALEESAMKDRKLRAARLHRGAAATAS